MQHWQSAKASRSVKAWRKFVERTNATLLLLPCFGGRSKSGLGNLYEVNFAVEHFTERRSKPALVPAGQAMESRAKVLCF